MRLPRVTGIRWRATVPSRSSLLGSFVAVAVLFGMLVLHTRSTAGPLDDPDPAEQRPGFLDDRPLPRLGAQLTDGRPAPGRRTVVFFVRRSRGPALEAALAAQDRLASRADVVMVAHEEAPEGPLPAVLDPDGRIAAGYGMRTPRDGGYPVGYAIVDRSRRVRYATLDPEVVNGLAEVDTMLGAVP